MKRRVDAAVLLLLLVTGCSGNHYLSKEIVNAGLKELRPPVDTLTPGTVIYVESQSQKSVTVGRVCSQANAVGEGVSINDGNGADTDLARKLSGEWKLDADYLNQLSAGVGDNFVKDVSLKLSNVHILEIDDDVAFKGRGDHQTAECKQAVSRRRAEGKRVAMVKKSFKADAEYSVTFKNTATLTAETKEQIINNVKAKLGGNVTVEGSRLVAGKGLVWGILESESLLDDTVNAATSTVRQIIKPGAIVLFSAADGTQ